MMSAWVESLVRVNDASPQWKAPAHVWRPATTLGRVTVAGSA
jgi:hypothetical protein